METAVTSTGRPKLRGRATRGTTEKPNERLDPYSRTVAAATG